MAAAAAADEEADEEAGGLTRGGGDAILSSQYWMSSASVQVQPCPSGLGLCVPCAIETSSFMTTILHRGDQMLFAFLLVLITSMQ